MNRPELQTNYARNLSIIAHIDHGKSTLADRLLEVCYYSLQSTVAHCHPDDRDYFRKRWRKSASSRQGTLILLWLAGHSNASLQLKVERERGITVKAQTVSLLHKHKDGHTYLLNLIDTPGHVDFSYEVSRSLGACEGALLLVDCTRTSMLFIFWSQLTVTTEGIQAQTLSVFHVAQESNLVIIPVINKVDLPHASPAATSAQIAQSLALPETGHLKISAKSGLGVSDVLDAIVEALPAPPAWQPRAKEEATVVEGSKGKAKLVSESAHDGKLRALVFDT